MSFHEYKIDEIFSNADGSVQFIELSGAVDNGENFWFGQSISVTQNGVTHSFSFPANLPSTATANTHVLIATQAFADLGIVTPNFIVPAGFLFTGGGVLNYAGVDGVSYAALPSDGIHSVDRAGVTMTATPTNFQGVTGQMSTTTTLNGTAGNDVLTGQSGDEAINGLAGNDQLSGGGGHDTLDGGTGTDTAVVGVSFAGMLSFQPGPTQTHITTSNADLVLTGIERISLTDKLIVFDTHAGEPAWQAAALLSAGFGPTQALHELAQWVPLSGEGTTMAQLAQQMIDHYAPGVSTPALVTYLYGSIAGISPTAGRVAEFADQVGAGKTYATNGDLLAFAAGLSINTDKMADFVGTVQQLDLPAH
ncbi:MAG: calcium-binding protein [Ramlibacter sp.]|nr:calcium-binding protein [Ramlibacter sp.]